VWSISVPAVINQFERTLDRIDYLGAHGGVTATRRERFATLSLAFDTGDSSTGMPCSTTCERAATMPMPFARSIG
jgi:hypothetical protein